MTMYDEYYIKEIANLPYPQTVDKWSLPEEVIYEYIRIYRKQLSLDQFLNYIIKIKDQENRNQYSNKHSTIKQRVDFCKRIYKDELNYEISLEKFIYLYNNMLGEDLSYYSRLRVSDFVNFFNDNFNKVQITFKEFIYIRNQLKVNIHTLSEILPCFDIEKSDIDKSDIDENWEEFKDYSLINDKKPNPFYIKSFAKIMNNMSSIEIFSGGDFEDKNFGTYEELFDVRSYKIFELLGI